MATTLILSTSCAPVKRPTASPHGDSASDDPSSTSGWSDVGNNGFDTAKVKNACDTTGHTAIDNDAGDTTNFHGGHSCHHHHVPSSSTLSSHPQGSLLGDSTHGQSLQRHGVEFIGNLQALPVQCDITIIPRAHPADSSANATSSLDTNDHVNSYDGNESMNILQPIRITKQHFHPCGIDNIVRLANTGTVSSDFILSLANCGVTVAMHKDENEEVRILPVQAVPSSFAVPSFDSVEEEMGRGDNMPYSYSGGETHSVEEVAVSFDFSIAVDVYQQRLDESAVAAAMLNHNNKHPHHRVNNQSWNDGTAWQEKTAQHSTTAITNMKSMEINSIMSTLENESQFIKKTLVVLGSFGFGLLICMVWTIWKLERGRRARRSSSRVQVKKVFVDNVPFEIIGTANNTATATAATKSRGGGVTSLRSHPSSLRSNNGKAQHFPEEISPIRSLVSLNEVEEEKEKVNGLPATTLDNRETKLHETLHLITPQDVTGSSSGGSTCNNEEGGKQSSSPRHWYEDFLSPRGCSKKAPRNRIDDVLFSGNEEVARSLFCSSSSSSSSNKVSPATMDHKTSFDKSKGATSSSVLNAPKKKVLVTPIERLSVSPPPSDISPLKLSKGIDSSKSPLMMSTETEETHDSSTRDDLDEPSSSIGVVDKEEKSCDVSPISLATEESSGTIKPVGTQVNTPKPMRSRTLNTPATDISISSQESQTSTTQKSRETLSSRDGLEEPPPSIDVAKDESCDVSPVSMAATDADVSSGTIKPNNAQVNTPKPKRSRTLKTPATDISISSQESQSSTSQTRKARKKFAEELAKKAGLTPPPTNKSDFSSSIARRAAEVQTPKKTLTPLSASSSPCDDEPSPFLADYW
eukprot:scaffold40447_cov228-Skeletonema_dohrnii-CCMP3373.AAC.1